MVELWGKRNVARLAKESGVARESVSKILSYKRGVGPEVGPRLAAVLQLDPAELESPQARPVTLVSIDHRLESLEAEVHRIFEELERGRLAFREVLESLEAGIVSVDERLSGELGGAQK